MCALAAVALSACGSATPEEANPSSGAQEVGVIELHVDEPSAQPSVQPSLPTQYDYWEPDATDDQHDLWEEAITRDQVAVACEKVESWWRSVSSTDHGTWLAQAQEFLEPSWIDRFSDAGHFAELAGRDWSKFSMLSHIAPGTNYFGCIFHQPAPQEGKTEALVFMFNEVDPLSPTRLYYQESAHIGATYNEVDDSAHRR